MRKKEGFSLLELLICVAIIGILMTMYLTTFGKAQRKANQVAGAEGMRQGQIGRLADGANESGRRSAVKLATREECRAAYREEVADGMFATRLLYRVRNIEEFEAYFYTLIDIEATEELEFVDGRLDARNQHGERFFLSPIGNGFHDAFSSVPVSWEFLSIYMGDMNGTSIGCDVMWGDARVDFVHYPGPFPIVREVAELSRRFMIQSELNS